MKKPEIPPPPEISNRSANQPDISSPSKDKNISLDICSLREKSKDLDLPLISALCNDKSLLKQTNTIDMATEQRNQWYNNTDDNSAKDESSVIGKANKSMYSLDNSQPQDKSLTKSTTSKNKSTFRSISKGITMGTSRNETKKSSDSTIAHKIGFSLSDTRIFDRSKFTNCDVPAKLDKSTESGANCNLKCQPNAEPAQSSAKIKSSSKFVNSKLSKASTSANKLKYPVSQPINKATKSKSASISENNLKFKFKSLKIKSDDVSQRNGNGDGDKTSS